MIGAWDETRFRERIGSAATAENLHDIVCSTNFDEDSTADCASNHGSRLPKVSGVRFPFLIPRAVGFLDADEASSLVELSGPLVSLEGPELQP